jgi:molecular chaperone GrpE
MVEKNTNSNEIEFQDEENIEKENDNVLEGEVEELQDEALGLEKALEEAKNKADEYLDGWQRARADFANYKKRVERDQSQTYQMATGSVIKRFLDILDDLDRALKNKPESGDGATWANGIELIYRKMLSILESEGVVPMKSDHMEFDPNLHEAISSEESDHHKSGEIIETLQQGYMIGDRVLRPAVVRVAK